MLTEATWPPIKVDLGEERSYHYHIQSLDDVASLMYASGLRIGKYLLVTDHNVGKLYGNELISVLEHAGWHVKSITVQAGEKAKGYADLHNIYDEALSWGIDRKTPVIALGGGVVGDFAFFSDYGIFTEILDYLCWIYNGLSNELCFGFFTKVAKDSYEFI